MLKINHLNEWDKNYVDLKENEYLFKVDVAAGEKFKKTPMGFLTKLTQKLVPPIPFVEWRQREIANGWSKNMPTYLFEETFRWGWKIIGTRIGKSQEWVIVEHPLGFELEIHLSSLMDIITKQEVNIYQGCLDDEWMWKENKLIKKL